MSWIKAAIKAITKRTQRMMLWQVSLSLLAQPVFDEESAERKSDYIKDLTGKLGVEEEQEELDDQDTLALLRMAGRMPVRIINPDGSVSS